MRRPGLNNDRIFSLILLTALVTANQSLSALSTDKDQPIEVEADTAELDDIKNISIYRGNVIVVQGSIRMTGDVMTVHHTDDDELETLIMEGNPATYRQLPDNSSVYDEAEALRMEYYELKNLVILINKAWTRQKDTRLSGDRIEYNTELSQVKAWRKPKELSRDETGETKKDERVRIVIKKKKNAEQPVTPDDN